MTGRRLPRFAAVVTVTVRVLLPECFLKEVPLYGFASLNANQRSVLEMGTLPNM